MSNEHVAGVFDSPRGYQPKCSCGWVGYETDRMSNDFAWTNANDQTVEHRRKVRDAHKTALEVAK